MYVPRRPLPMTLLHELSSSSDRMLDIPLPLLACLLVLAMLAGVLPHQANTTPNVPLKLYALKKTDKDSRESRI